METKDILHELEFSATPTQVYEALMNAETHGDITGANADIEDKEGLFIFYLRFLYYWEKHSFRKAK